MLPEEIQKNSEEVLGRAETRNESIVEKLIFSTLKSWSTKTYP